MKKLYEVEVTYTGYVLADDEMGGEEAADEIVQTQDPEMVTARALSAKDRARLPLDVKQSLPYGGDEKRTVEEYEPELARSEVEATDRARNKVLFDGVDPKPLAEEEP